MSNDSDSAAVYNILAFVFDGQDTANQDDVAEVIAGVWVVED
jgi:hypothetical protein